MRPNVDYTNYLQLDKILDAQELESLKQSGQSAHEEMLFIVTHQTYELWFKQILWEVDSVIKIFDKKEVSEQELSLCVHRLKRVNEIWKILIQQISVLESMTPLEFLDFREYLYPASGFQSHQFRLTENKLGLREKDRKVHSGCPYHHFLQKEKQQMVLESEKTTSLLEAVESWLERTPYLESQSYNFWNSYKEAVSTMFKKEQGLIEKNNSLNPEEKSRSHKSILESQKLFESFMDKELFEENKERLGWKLSFEALHAALFIQLHRHELKLQSANRLIEELIDLDEHMTQWRLKHSLMASRMLGEKVGTGGSSGAEYLREAGLHHKIFQDFFKLTTYFVKGTQLGSFS